MINLVIKKFLLQEWLNRQGDKINLQACFAIVLFVTCRYSSDMHDIDPIFQAFFGHGAFHALRATCNFPIQACKEHQIAKHKTLIITQC